MTVASHKTIKSPAVTNALVSGTSASALSALALSVCSKLEEDSAAGALNGPSQWIWGEREAYTRRATLKHTLVGYLIHHASSILWATVYERCFERDPRGARVSTARILTQASATAALAYVVDYHVAPKRLRPGFKKHLDGVSLFVVYAAFGAGLAAATLARRRA